MVKLHPIYNFSSQSSTMPKLSMFIYTRMLLSIKYLANFINSYFILGMKAVSLILQEICMFFRH